MSDFRLSTSYSLRNALTGSARAARYAGTTHAPKFAEIVASAILAGELSMAGAITSGEFVGAHETYGRNRPPAP